MPSHHIGLKRIQEGVKYTQGGNEYILSISHIQDFSNQTAPFIDLQNGAVTRISKLHFIVSTVNHDRLCPSDDIHPRQSS